MTTTRTYRSRDQWQAIISDFSASGLSGVAFCSQNNLPYASFSKWRSRLTSNQAPDLQSDHNSAASFLDFSALSSGSQSSHWNITLKLGNGVELVLSQS